MNTSPPSAEKLALIREYLRVSGLQARIDNGQVIDRDSWLVRRLSEDLAEAKPDMSYADFLGAPTKALREAYAPHRAAWQEEYEGHLNWEFTEPELSALVAFFGSPVGQHLLEAQQRMEAYIGTNTEHLLEPIFNEARAKLIGPDIADGSAA